MLKIKSRLLVEKKKIEEAEEVKRIAKEVQAQKSKERAKHKKEEIESVKKWRKKRQQGGFARGKNEEMDFGDGGNNFQRLKKKRPGVSPSDRSGGFRVKEKNMKRVFRKSRFGHGGRKRMKKQNTAETTNDMSGFNNGNFYGSKKREVICSFVFHDPLKVFKI